MEDEATQDQHHQKDCPKCGGQLLIDIVERETAAGDFINQYVIARCSNPACDHVTEELIGGHCNPSWWQD